ncbi:hypothetical protein Peur_032645 [Populus x canadensis]
MSCILFMLHWISHFSIVPRGKVRNGPYGKFPAGCRRYETHQRLGVPTIRCKIRPLSYNVRKRASCLVNFLDVLNSFKGFNMILDGRFKVNGGFE